MQQGVFTELVATTAMNKTSRSRSSAERSQLFIETRINSASAI